MRLTERMVPSLAQTMRRRTAALTFFQDSSDGGIGPFLDYHCANDSPNYLSDRTAPGYTWAQDDAPFRAAQRKSSVL